MSPDPALLKALLAIISRPIAAACRAGLLFDSSAERRTRWQQGV